MSTRVQVSTNGEITSIQIGNSLNGRVIILFIIEALIAFGSAALFFNLLILDEDYPILMYLFLLAVIVIFSIVSFRYINKITELEIVEINRTSIIINHKSLLSSKSKRFNLDDISHFHFEGFPKYTDHPLKGESFDYLGFQTMDRQIQTVHEEGNISFEYDGHTVYFGKRLPSWEVEKINEAIISATANRFKIANLIELDVTPDE